MSALPPSPALREAPQSRPRRLLRRYWRAVLLTALVLVAGITGASLGYFMRLDLPDIQALEDYTPPVMSRVLDANGEVVATFAEQKRLLIRYPDIPTAFRDALISTEDAAFYSHTGIDMKGIVRALWRDLLQLKLAQGASTLTQQLARNLFLKRDKTLRRKVQEALLALEIERNYTKPEILRFYCNQIYMGHGRYGLEAAARYYVGKPAKELNLNESAMLAGLIQRPEALSPFKNPERSMERRNHVLRRMVDTGSLDAALASETSAEPLSISELRRPRNPAPYFVEEVRRWLQESYGSTTLYKEGFEASTTLDLRFQGCSNRAMDVGLRELDRRQGWRGVQERLAENEDLKLWESATWKFGIEIGEVYEAVVTDRSKSEATVRVGPHIGVLGKEQIAWTKTSMGKLLSAGDLIQVRVQTLDEEGNIGLSLEQEPVVEASLVAIDPATGEIKALVGGFDFERSEFNRAIQAKRQTGSAFKPLVFAAALERGRTLGDTIVDAPTVFLHRRLPEPYQPENYSRKYYETVTLRRAMEKSANIATVKLLNDIGYEAVIGLARSMGIDSELRSFPSLALGAFEISLLELTSAYGTFANHGVHVEPYLVREVRNREGALVTAFEPEVRDAVSRQTAYLMNRVLSGVITDGTGKAASSLGLHLAGKTGTTDNNTDAWFIGYSPDLAVGVWVGFDEPKSLGSKETGALAALPIWRAFMECAYTGQSNEDFRMPPDIVVTSVDRRTGLRANQHAGCTPVVSEVFVRGTEPAKYCTEQHHQLLGFPYAFQRFPLSDQGALLMPQVQLARILENELEVYVIDGGTRLEAHTEEGTFSLPLQIQPGGETAELPAWVRDRYDPSEWIGRDGKRAEIVWLK